MKDNGGGGVGGGGGEEQLSVSSPRRILSFKKDQRRNVGFSEEGGPPASFGVSGEYGPKPSEVYGFVGSITTIVAMGKIVSFSRVRG
ncbi:hypothetical protein MLD38_010180 [Melastoma candidum]|uniref:Uncharacterized protein n=1 Tax=Melastoma candidum TaxID=119954 RepID=A0ACB9R335_9MYRT|nr:hypothetical protein MLD38_010180 [Melastoma candidum]